MTERDKLVKDKERCKMHFSQEGQIPNTTIQWFIVIFLCNCFNEISILSFFFYVEFRRIGQHSLKIVKRLKRWTDTPYWTAGTCSLVCTASWFTDLHAAWAVFSKASWLMTWPLSLKLNTILSRNKPYCQLINVLKWSKWPFWIPLLRAGSPG